MNEEMRAEGWKLTMVPVKEERDSIADTFIITYDALAYNATNGEIRYMRHVGTKTLTAERYREIIEKNKKRKG